MKNLKIIAEVGVNHNGKISLAKKLIKSAKFAGADYVKFQCYSTDELVTPRAKKRDIKGNLINRISKTNVKKISIVRKNLYI